MKLNQVKYKILDESLEASFSDTYQGISDIPFLDAEKNFENNRKLVNDRLKDKKKEVEDFINHENKLIDKTNKKVKEENEMNNKLMKLTECINSFVNNNFKRNKYKDYKLESLNKNSVKLLIENANEYKIKYTIGKLNEKFTFKYLFNKEQLTEWVNVNIKKGTLKEDWREIQSNGKHVQHFRDDALAVDKEFADRIVQCVDEYIAEADRGVITYEQLTKYAKKLGINDAPYSELNKIWHDVQDVTNYYGFNTEDYKLGMSRLDAASAFAEVVNQLARDYRKNNPDQNKLDAINFIKELVNDEDSYINDSEGLKYIKSNVFRDIKKMVKDNNITQEELNAIDSNLFDKEYGYNMLEGKLVKRNKKQIKEDVEAVDISLDTEDDEEDKNYYVITPNELKEKVIVELDKQNYESDTMDEYTTFIDDNIKEVYSSLPIEEHTNEDGNTFIGFSTNEDYELQLKVVFVMNDDRVFICDDQFSLTVKDIVDAHLFKELTDEESELFNIDDYFNNELEFDDEIYFDDDVEGLESYGSIEYDEDRVLLEKEPFELNEDLSENTLLREINKMGKRQELEFLLEDMYPEGCSEETLKSLLNENADWIRSMLGM